MRLIRDTRGKGSWTLTLSIPAIVLITARFLFGGISIGACAPVQSTGFGEVASAPPGACRSLTPLSGSEYSLAIGVWLTLWAQREYIEKQTRNGGTSP